MNEELILEINEPGQEKELLRRISNLLLSLEIGEISKITVTINVEVNEDLIWKAENKLSNVSAVKAQGDVGRGRNGVIITFPTQDATMIGNKFGLIHNEHEHYFNVIEVSTQPDNSLLVSAIEVGYYNKFEKQSNLDLRDILGLKTYPITDPETIKKIRTESSYC